MALDRISWKTVSIMESFRSKRNLRRPPRDTVTITPLDHYIAQRGGTTTSIERLPHRLQMAKSKTNPTREELIKENNRLREEISLLYNS